MQCIMIGKSFIYLLSTMIYFIQSSLVSRDTGCCHFLWVINAKLDQKEQVRSVFIEMRLTL